MFRWPRSAVRFTFVLLLTLVIVARADPCTSNLDCPDDGDPCNGHEFCFDYRCIHSIWQDDCCVDEDCDDGSPDTIDTCTAGRCTYECVCPDDGDSCNGYEFCFDYRCLHSIASPECCSNADCDDGNPCNGIETCSSGFGCVAGTPLPDGLPCDLDECWQNTTCQAGECVGQPVECPDDGNPCNGQEFCNPDYGCAHTEPPDDGHPCEDGDPCTLRDVCAEGSCHPDPNGKCFDPHHPSFFYTAVCIVDVRCDWWVKPCGECPPPAICYGGKCIDDKMDLDYERDFHNSWLKVLLKGVGKLAVDQLFSEGNPGAFGTLALEPAAGPLSMESGIHTSAGVLYTEMMPFDLATSGPIRFVGVDFDSRLLAGSAASVGILLRQDEGIYEAPLDEVVDADWTRHQLTAAAKDFRLVDTGVVAAESPDFSVHGAPIEFGLVIANYTPADVSWSTWGIDNLNIWVTPGSSGDFDGDLDVDLEDFEHLSGCGSGPAMPQANPECSDTDLDMDGDVDQTDFGLFQKCFSGRGAYADPACRD